MTRGGYKNSFPQPLEYHAPCSAVMMSLLSCLLSCCNFHIIHFAPALSPGRWGSPKQMIFTILSCSAYLNSLYNFQVGWHLISRPNLKSQHTIMKKMKPRESNNFHSGVVTTGDMKGRGSLGLIARDPGTASIVRLGPGSSAQRQTVASYVRIITGATPSVIFTFTRHCVMSIVQ